ncbi:MAG: YbgC/FadM family acyl-CoA thioesterase [Rhizobacter sp.]
MKRDEFRFTERLRVRWVEVDMQKIVFNGHYLMYFDTAVSGYWRALAVPYGATMEYLGGDLYVRKATVEYQGSARYDDGLEVGVRCARIGNSSLVFQCAVFRQDQLLVSGELVYVFADPVTQKSKPVPQELRDVLQGFEAGKSMVEVRVGSWDELGKDAHRIRTSVFIDEQNIPKDMEWDEADPDPNCVHAVAYNRFGQALGTGRLLEHVPGVAKIGRMAVSQGMRGSRVGNAVLEALMGAARERGYREAVLHAQMSASGFYTRAGFTTRGAMFEEVGIPHIEMVRVL